MSILDEQTLGNRASFQQRALESACERRAQVALITAMAADERFELGRHRGGIEQLRFAPALLVWDQHALAGIAEGGRCVTVVRFAEAGGG